MYLASQQNLLVSHELAVLVAKSAWIPSHTLSNKAGQEDSFLPTGLHFSCYDTSTASLLWHPIVYALQQSDRLL